MIILKKPYSFVWLPRLVHPFEQTHLNGYNRVYYNLNENIWMGNIMDIWDNLIEWFKWTVWMS